MTKIKKNDFVKLEYTGKLKEEDKVFDTTDKEKAKEAGIHSENMNYGPVTICIGEGQILPGLEEELEGKETQKEYTIELQPEKAFGKKQAKLIKTISTSSFKKQNIVPQPGLQVNIDGSIGVIKRVGGGRCLVDFNHPLSSKEVKYKIKIDKIVKDDKEKIKSYVSLALNLKDVSVEIKDKKAVITLKKQIPEQATKKIGEKLKELIPSIKEINFKIEEKNKSK